MPVTMGGVASGMDTDAIIEKLVNVESRPIQMMQRDIAVSKGKKAALEALRERLKDLEKTSQELYGFRSSYEDKNAVSSAPEVLTASASKLAEKGQRSVEVMKLASAHVISTDEMEDGTEIPAGKFTITVDGQSFPVSFKGGSLKAFQQKIDEAAGEKISTALIKTSSGRNLVTLSSRISGSRGEIMFSGDMSLPQKTGLAGENFTERNTGADIKFDRRYFSIYTGVKSSDEQYGSLKVSDDGNSVNVAGPMWQEYSLPVEISVKKSTVLLLSLNYNEETAVPEQDDCSRLVLGPEEKTVIGDVELRGYNIERVRNVPEKQKVKTDDLTGTGIILSDDRGRRSEKFYSIKPESYAEHSIEIGKDLAGKKITGIVLYCADGSSVFSDVRIHADADSGKSFEPKHVIAEAADARMKVDGIEVTREKNNDLIDVIKGVTLNLKSVSSVPVIIKTDQDIDKAAEKIKAFVASYNNYLDLHFELTKTERSSKPGEFDKNKENTGLFAGDMTIIRLENMLSSTLSAPYPSSAEHPLRLLSDMGVSTGKVNSAWSSIKQGKLVIDEELLRKTISENPEGVRLFFGSDTDGDNREDNGMAFTLNRQLDAYVGPGKNVISTKIALEDDSIKAGNERIAKKEEHIKQYEDKLRKKFASMEEAMSGANAQKSWMNQQMGGAASQSSGKQ